MKNLKKVLSLALAMVMAMSLMTTAFAADVDFTDADEITNVEAVEVMAAIGILEGNNGEFDPQGTLTREQAAKMITYMLLGTTDAEKQPAKAIFGDVKADRWSASYIAYCATEGIIAGKSATTFAPAANVTGYEYAKMLLCALGYDATEKGLTGDSWAINTGKYFVAEGLDVDGVDMNADLSRENAAQMTLNAMQWTADEDVYRVIIDNVAHDFDSESSALAYYVALNNNTNDQWVGKTAATTGTLLRDVYNVIAGRGTDAFGRPANTYVLDDDDSTVLTYADAPVATFTGAVTEKALFNVVKADPAGTSTTVAEIDAVVEDGNGQAGFNVNKTGTQASWNAPYTGNGITTEVYELTDINGDETYVLVSIREYLGVVDKVNKADATTETARTIEVKLDKVPSGMESTRLCADYETEDFAKDDVVLVTVSTKTGEPVVQTIEKATKVENVTVTAKNAGTGVDNASFVGNGTTYALSQNSTMTTTNVGNLVLGGATTYNLWLDSFGNVLKYGTYAATNTDYYYVIAATTDNLKVDAFGSATYDSYKLVGMDGKIVTVKAVDGASNRNVATQDTIVTFTDDKDNEGYVVFDQVQYADGYRANTAAKLDKTTPKVANGLIADANTIFVLTTDNTKDKITVVTGIANVPGYATVGNVAYGVIDENGYADVIFLDLTSKTADSSVADDLVYLFANTSSDAVYDAANEVTYYVYDAIIDGVKTTIKSQDSTLNAAGLAKITAYDAYGYVETASAISSSTGVYNVASLSNATVTYGAPTLTVAGTSYLTTANTVVYMIDADDALTVADLGDLVGTDVDGSIWMIEVSTTDATIATIYFDGTVADAAV